MKSYKYMRIYPGMLTFLLLFTATALSAQTLPEQTKAVGEVATSWFFRPRWSPYMVGIGIGILSWLAFILSDHPLGCSTAYARTSGMIEKAIRGDKAVNRSYYKEFAPVIDWEWMLVFGVVIGAFIAAITSGDFVWIWTPAKWVEAFGGSAFWRVISALAGGVLIGFGSRWAKGCTSGHGLSGTLQLAASSWLAVVCFFIGGIITAMFIFRVLT